MATELIKVSELPVKTTDFADGDLMIVSEYNAGTYVSKSRNLFALGFIPIGGGCEWYAAAAPAGFLFQDGSAVSRTTYAALFAVIGTTWGVGDSTTTFNLPDKREAASVGIGTRASGVTAHDGFTLAQFKDDQSQGHVHVEDFPIGSSSATRTNPGLYIGFGGYTNTLSDATSYGPTPIITGRQASDGTDGTPRVGTVTRGKRIGVNFVIKY
jgi:microcystin-dependent protein